MKKRGDYLKKAYYHLMKIEQKKNKILQVENYGEINAELNRKFAKGEYFDSSEVYVEDGYLCVGEGFFRLSGKAKICIAADKSIISIAKVSSAFPEKSRTL